MTTGLRVVHNIEAAHRLSLLPGKCEAIHGHSMLVTLTLYGPVNVRTGILADLDFSLIKKAFRSHLDAWYDHRLLLFERDPFVQSCAKKEIDIPGLRACTGDPTTENIARWIGMWAQSEWTGSAIETIHVEVAETRVNKAFWEGAVP